MADEHDKKFANTHYPGIHADPNEGRHAMDEGVRWRLGAQVACLGEEAQLKLLSGSAFVMGASPLGVAIARKLLGFGLGRVGVFDDEPLTGAHGLGVPGEPALTTLQALSALSKAEAPWAQLETFRAASIDRSLDDMSRGFDLLIAARGPAEVSLALTQARETGRPVIAAETSGRQAWCSFVPAQTLCPECLGVPALEAASGLYFPLVDVVAGWISVLAIEMTLGSSPRTPFVETLDASRSPWARETREAVARAGCGACSRPS